MAQSRHLQVIFSRRPTPEVTDPRFSESCGDKIQLQLLKGTDLISWKLVGHAFQFWNDEVRPFLNELCEEDNEISWIFRSQQLTCLCDCYMIGRNQSAARPTVVIACDSKDLRQCICDKMKEDRRVRSQGFEFMNAPLGGLRPLTGIMDRANVAHVQLREDSKTLFGHRMKIGNTGRFATLGGFLVADGVFCALTAAHPFKESLSKLPDFKSGVESFSFYDLDSESHADTISDLEDEKYHHLQSGFETEDGNRDLASRVSLGNEVQSTAGSEHRSNSTFQLPVKGIAGQDSIVDGYDSAWECGDWALLDVEQLKRDLVPMKNEIFLDGPRGANSFLVKDFSVSLLTGEVLVCRNDLATRGEILSNACSIKFENSGRFCEVWAVKLISLPDVGDSGAWVIERDTGSLVGMLIADSPALEISYIMPIQTIRTDIIKKMGFNELRLPNDTDTRLTESAISNFAKIHSTQNLDTLLSRWNSEVQNKKYSSSGRRESEKREGGNDSSPGEPRWS